MNTDTSKCVKSIEMSALVCHTAAQRPKVFNKLNKRRSKHMYHVNVYTNKYNENKLEREKKQSISNSKTIFAIGRL